jgi:hypothetical protein
MDTPLKVISMLNGKKMQFLVLNICYINTMGQVKIDLRFRFKAILAKVQKT